MWGDGERLSRAELLDRRENALGASRPCRGGLCLFLQRRADRPRSLWLAGGAAFRAPAAARFGPDRTAGDDGGACGPPPCRRRRRLLPAAPLPFLRLGDLAGERGGGPPGDLLFPSLGDRSRPAPRRRRA